MKILLTDEMFLLKLTDKFIVCISLRREKKERTLVEKVFSPTGKFLPMMHESK